MVATAGEGTRKRGGGTLKGEIKQKRLHGSPKLKKKTTAYPTVQSPILPELSKKEAQRREMALQGTPSAPAPDPVAGGVRQKEKKGKDALQEGHLRPLAKVPARTIHEKSR